MKSLRLLAAAAAVVAVVAPAANAGIRCTVYYEDQRIGPVTIHDVPQCAW